MKTRAALVAGALLISGSLALPTPGFTRDDDHDNGRTERYDRRDYNNRDARDLQGTWYMNGDHNKRAEINGNARNLQARNENGDTSRLEIDRNGNVHASAWQGLIGHVRGNRIEWDNGTTWTRR